MTPIEDKDYLRICADLAKNLSVSLAAAKRQVELSAAKQGSRDIQSRKTIAEDLLRKSQENLQKGKDSSAKQLDVLLEVLTEDKNFMVED